jgi:hypothetical protein
VKRLLEVLSVFGVGMGNWVNQVHVLY